MAWLGPVLKFVGRHAGAEFLKRAGRGLGERYAAGLQPAAPSGPDPKTEARLDAAEARLGTLEGELVALGRALEATGERLSRLVLWGTVVVALALGIGLVALVLALAP